MKMKLGKEGIKESLGEVMLLGYEVKHPYDNEKNELITTKIDYIMVNLACTELDSSIEVKIEPVVLEDGTTREPSIPNVKKWGRVNILGLVYDPSAVANSFEDRTTGKSRSFGKLNERFFAIGIVPATSSDRRADENGEVVSSEKTTSNDTNKNPKK